MNRRHAHPLNVWILGALLSLTAALPALGEPASEWKVNTWAGAGALGGATTYEIGGAFQTADYEDTAHFPISRLEWPANAVLATVGGSVEYRGVGARLEAGKSLTSDAGKVRNSDWEDSGNPTLLTIFSETDADFTAWLMDGSLHLRVPLNSGKGKTRARIGGGFGLFYQDSCWEANNLDQWYPAEPLVPHDYQDGLIGTYETRVTMPYIEISGDLSWGPVFFEGRIGVSPYAMVTDIDDHKLRYIRAETDATGSGLLGELLVRYTFPRFFFVQGTLFMLGFDVKGTEHDVVYAGDDAGDTWQIEHKVTGEQMAMALSCGAEF